MRNRTHKTSFFPLFSLQKPSKNGVETILQCLNSNLVRVLFTCNSCLNSMLQRANSTFFVQKCRFDCFFHSCLFLFRNFSIAVLLSSILTKIGSRRFCIASILYLSLCNMFFQFISSVNIMCIEVRGCAYFETSFQQLQRSSSKTLLCEKLCTYTRNSLMGNKR